jgi:hypothetical protein
MNPMLMAVMMVLAVLASCNRSASGPASGDAGGSGTLSVMHKVEGPPIDRLSMDQINGVVQTCFVHHDLDDPRVPYTRRYCEKVFAERDLRSMKTPGKSVVHAAVDSLH